MFPLISLTKFRMFPSFFLQIPSDLCPLFLELPCVGDFPTPSLPVPGPPPGSLFPSVPWIRYFLFTFRFTDFLRHLRSVTSPPVNFLFQMLYFGIRKYSFIFYMSYFSAENSYHSSRTYSA